MADKWTLLNCRHPGVDPASSGNQGTPQCGICEEQKVLDDAARLSRRQKRMCLGFDNGVKQYSPSHFVGREEGKRIKSRAMLDHIKLANYRDRAHDLKSRFMYITAIERLNETSTSAAVSSNASKKRKREDAESRLESFVYDHPPFKRPRPSNYMYGYKDGDDFLCKMERNNRYDMMTLCNLEKEVEKKQKERQLAITESELQARKDLKEDSLSSKRKHEEEEQEDDRPRKRQRRSSPAAEVKWVAGMEPGTTYRRPCRKDGPAPMVVRTNVMEYSPKGPVRSKAVRFNVAPDLEGKKERHERNFMRLSRRYEPGRWAARDGYEHINTSGYRDPNWPATIMQGRGGSRPTSGTIRQVQTHIPSNSSAMVPFVGEQKVAEYIINRETATQRGPHSEGTEDREQRQEAVQDLGEDPSVLDPLYKAWRKCARTVGRMPWVGNLIPAA